MNRKVTYARLQTNTYIKDVGEMGNTLPPQSKTLEGLNMTSYGADGLHVEFFFQGKKKEIWVPSSNIAICELAPEEPKKTVVKAA